MFRLIIFSCLFLANFASLAHGLRRTAERILGGRNTYITEVPHQVSVQFGYHHTCGGSIIGEKHIVTAAHCVEGKTQLTVRAGSQFHSYGGQDIEVEKTAIHPKYDSTTSNYDAAVLKLKTPLTFGNTVRPIKLANTEPKEGEEVLISGWGILKEDEEKEKKEEEKIKEEEEKEEEKNKEEEDDDDDDDEEYEEEEEEEVATTYLHSVKVSVVSRKTCEKKLKIFNPVTNAMFCAGYQSGGKGGCMGDSGGPAVVDGKLAGIMSWGEGCGRRYSPDVYTNVAHIRDWIKKQTLD